MHGLPCVFGPAAVRRTCALLPALWLALGSAACALRAGAGAPAEEARAPAAARAAAEADVRFMSGMIPHHAQAVLIASWAESHEAGPAVRALAERMLVSQRDEIEFMRRWLEDRGRPVPPVDPRGLLLPGMHHPEAMPGMLTPEELAALDGARGDAFDRLFLTLMIRHHEGALQMVAELLAQPGAAQDEAVFRFAADVDADQRAEIARMRALLAASTAGGP